MNEIIIYTRGDDCGISLGTNLAIYDACKYGILKNVSLILVPPYIKNAYDILKDLEDVSFGLHITLTCEWKNIKWGPILEKDKVPSLIDENGFFILMGKQFLKKNKQKRNGKRD